MRWLEVSKTFRGLFHLNQDVSSSNDHAWAVASTLGHVNPSSVSLKSYVHCLNLWLSLALEFTSSPGGEVAQAQRSSPVNRPYTITVNEERRPPPEARIAGRIRADSVPRAIRIAGTQT